MVLSSSLQYLLDKTYPPYLRDRFGLPISYLGSGAFGYVWLLEDNSVIKITSSINEAKCVETLFDIQEKYPNIYIKHLPIIYEYGEFGNLENDDWRFYYRREDIKDIPRYMERNEDEWENKKDIAKYYVIDNLRLKMLDIKMSNTGIRKDNDKDLIFRDLECVTQ